MPLSEDVEMWVDCGDVHLLVTATLEWQHPEPGVGIAGGYYVDLWEVVGVDYDNLTFRKQVYGKEALVAFCVVLGFGCAERIYSDIQNALEDRCRELSVDRLDERYYGWA